MHEHNHSFILEPVLVHSFLVISFVFSMMLIIEFLNYFTAGKWQTFLFKSKFKTFVIATLLGLSPGCLGAFFVISLYSHGIVGLGALTAVLIASSGDESFIMIKLIPKAYLYLNIVLFFVAILFAYLTDFVLKNKYQQVCIIPTKNDCKLVFSRTFDKTKKIFLSFYFLVILLLILTLSNDHKESYFVLLSNLICFSLLVFTHPHFIHDHIYKHLVKKHILKLTLWTFAAFTFVHLIIDHVCFDKLVENYSSVMLIIASFLGLIPESGPHIVFTKLYAEALIPFSILLANSISQDGHAGIPLLSESKKTFIIVKIINLIAALTVGFIFLKILNL